MVNDGGPAFPVGKDDVERYSNWDGLSLRDYFAAKAMQSIIMVNGGSTNYFQDEAQAIHAEMAYSMADSMLAARKI